MKPAVGLTMPSEANKIEEENARHVREMFARIALRYDFLNHLLSVNADRRWRRRVTNRLRGVLPAGGRVLDVACGTGDLSVELVRATGARVFGLDFCRPMLELATAKAPQIPFIEGDALRAPFADGSFDAVTIAFGLRNLSSAEAGLKELFRLLKPGRWAAILEFSRPSAPGFRSVFDFYFTRLLPRVGGLVSGSRSAYQYLPDSVARFPDQSQLAVLMRRSGFEEVEFENLTGGIAALHVGKRPL
jgi:demethylmenaquinone methyltransferase / 2-methoxy-6-polyprenyl-1,4-benzoquinol methylase